MDYRIEPLTEIDQFRQCLEIQRAAWGFADEDVLPLRGLVVCSKIGGQVFGAMDGDGKVLGFINAFPGYREGQVFLHSNMMGVRPEFQNLGIGWRLKLAQREESLSRGIHLIEWTFDPLEVRNARFNLELLGAMCRRYLVNTYGVTTSHLHGGLPTDRLVAEWHLDNPRVQARMERLKPDPFPDAPAGVVEFPLDIGETRSRDPNTALRVQMSLRERMLQFLEGQLCLTRFEIDRQQQKARYFFEPSTPATAQS